MEMSRLKEKNPLHIVSSMKNAFLLSLFLFTAPSLLAQSSGFGFLIGGAQPADNGISFRFRESVREVFYETEIDPGTLFKIKAGQTDLERDLDPGAPNLERDGRLDYIDGLIEYRFYESFGSTGLFAGPGIFRRRFGNEEETNYGLAAGVNALFPVTRRFGLIAEVTYRWGNFETDRAIVTATGGLRISF